MDLADKTCVPCRGGVPPMERAEAERMLAQLGGGWQLADNGHLFLEKTYRFKDFAEALQFVGRVGALAEEQAHHPDVYLTWGRVRVQIWTHKIKGLTESDFVFAAKCDRV
jgi:4a-hydroxytetrahydrobiopterin dehydratase